MCQRLAASSIKTLNSAVVISNQPLLPFSACRLNLCAAGLLPCCCVAALQRNMAAVWHIFPLCDFSWYGGLKVTLHKGDRSSSGGGGLGAGEKPPLTPAATSLCLPLLAGRVTTPEEVSENLHGNILTLLSHTFRHVINIISRCGDYENEYRL